LFANVERVKATLRKLETSGRPVVAAINGAALGGGPEIARACPHRVAADGRYEIGLPEVSSLRSVALTRSTLAKSSGASAGVACVISLRSPPAKKVFFAEDTTAPLTASPWLATSSAKALTACSIESVYAWFIVLAL
ncbi:MAG: hypothetical protein H7290_01415, partial [Flavobacterium sp.]|nr:hypothetical protein [Aeromicrobium sp.]